jgi:glycosyltransferase involved in cell wall biosynthesis
LRSQAEAEDSAEQIRIVMAEKDQRRGPAIPEIGVLGLVPDIWGGPWMSRHHIMTRLGEYLNVVWFDPAHEWRELWLSRSQRVSRPVEAAIASNGFQIYRPGRWLPRVYRPSVVADLTERVRLHQAVARLRSRGARHIVLYLWRPDFAHVVDMVPHDMSCYHIDDEYSFAPTEQPLDPKEVALIERVDQVIIHSSKLVEKKGHFNPNTAVIPNGADYRAFATPVPEPADLQGIRHPRIGYVGMVKEQLDLELLRSLAERHHEWSFVFVGPSSVPESNPDLRALRACANVHFLGGKHVSELPAYMQHMDVCTLPYAMDDYTKYIYPMKLHEYLATGRPVVGRPISALLDFSDLISLALTPSEWSEAINSALQPAAIVQSAQEARRTVARKHDWNRHATSVARLFCEHLGRSYVDRLVSASAERPSHETGARN